MPACDVVVPYFQRSKGVLRRTLRAAFEQSFQDFRIIIVDDGSPQPAGDEIDGLPEAARGRIKVISQANGGVSAARNTGLDHVSEDARFIAFLDSDDAWARDHLAQADAVMNVEGVDFFWDSIRAPADFGEFLAPSKVIEPDHRVPLDGAQWAFEVASLKRTLLGPWWRHMHLSCTVISPRLAESVRFDPRLKYCEDFLFFYHCAAKARRVAASDAPGADRGQGDNQWHGVSFTDPRCTLEKLTMAKILKQMRADADYDADDRELIDLRRQVNRELFYWSQRQSMREGRGVDGRAWMKWLQTDPKIAPFVLSMVAKTNKNRGQTVIPEDLEGRVDGD